MKAYLKFAASFWMNAFLTIGSMATASRSSTRRKKNSAASAAPSAAVVWVGIRRWEERSRARPGRRRRGRTRCGGSRPGSRS